MLTTHMSKGCVYDFNRRRTSQERIENNTEIDPSFSITKNEWSISYFIFISWMRGAHYKISISGQFFSEIL